MVHLAVFGERQGGEQHDLVRDHVHGQPVLKKRQQLVLGNGCAAAVGAGVCRERGFGTGRGRAGDDDGVPYVRVLPERCRHFPGLDPEAPDLDLFIRAAQEFQLAVGAPADQVAGAVQACAGLSGEGVGAEALFGQFRAVDVAAGHRRAAEEQFAADT
ncbi:hypothetical protein GCM10020295_08650 [Streptomyces cinereospinus]